MKLKQYVFSGRQRELDRLMTFLDQAVNGNGSIVSLVGDAGSGKTWLALEFLQRAQSRYDDLIYAVGTCSEHVGVGEPYLPFKEAFYLLCGGTEYQLSQTYFSAENVERLSQASVMIKSELLNQGPNLIGALVPHRLSFEGDQSQAGYVPKLESVASDSFAKGVRTAFFLECLLVLRKLAQQFPLILLLEDLQWSDTASTDLLAYLRTKLQGSAILLVVTYRSSEVVSSKRTLAAVDKVQLNKASSSFVNEFVRRNYTSHQFSPEFLARMQDHTAGNPLFVSELFKYLEGAHICQDDQGCWKAEDKLEFYELPASVTKTIELRISHLEANLRKVLETASVEGEEFTSEVVARIRKVNEQKLLEQLSEELERKWHLVTQSRAVSHRKHLSVFRFRHALIRTYLYHRLQETERVSLHRDVGLFLESLYGPDDKHIRSTLAEHFKEANMPEKEALYRLLAAQDSFQVGAWGTALHHLDRLESILYSTGGFLSEQTRTSLATGSSMAEQKPEGYEQEHLALLRRKLVTCFSDEELRTLCFDLGIDYDDLGGRGRKANARELIAHLDRRGHIPQFLEVCVKLRPDVSWEDMPGTYPQMYEPLKLAKKLYNLRGGIYALLLEHNKALSDFAQLETIAHTVGDTCSAAQAICGRGVLARAQNNLRSAIKYVSRAYVLVRGLQCTDLVAECSLLAAKIKRDLGQYAKSIRWAERALALYVELDNLGGMIDSLSQIAYAYYASGQYSKAEGIWMSNLSTCNAFGIIPSDPDDDPNFCLGFLNWRLGNYELAKKYFLTALKSAQQTDNLRKEVYCKNDLAFVETALGNYTEAEELLREVIDICESGDFEDKKLLSWALGNLGDNFAQAGHFDEALKWLKRNRALALKQGNRSDTAESSRRLSELCLQFSELHDSYEYALMALQEAQEIGRLDFVSKAYRILGGIAVTVQHEPETDVTGLQEPEVYFRQSLQVARETSNTIEIERTLEAWGKYLQGLPSRTSQDKGAEFIREAQALREKLPQLPKDVALANFTVEDAHHLIAAINQVSESTPWMWGQKYIPTLEWEHALSEPECTRHLLLVSKKQERVVGWCRLFPQNSCADSKSASYDLGIGVLPEYQKQGLGTRMLKVALGWATANRFTQVTLTTHQKNVVAQALFKGFGFQIQEQRGEHLFMICELSNQLVRDSW